VARTNLSMVWGKVLRSKLLSTWNQPRKETVLANFASQNIKTTSRHLEWRKQVLYVTTTWFQIPCQRWKSKSDPRVSIVKRAVAAVLKTGIKTMVRAYIGLTLLGLSTSTVRGSRRALHHRRANLVTHNLGTLNQMLLHLRQGKTCPAVLQPLSES